MCKKSTLCPKKRHRCGCLWTEPVSCKCSKWRPLAIPHATDILQEKTLACGILKRQFPGSWFVGHHFSHVHARNRFRIQRRTKSVGLPDLHVTRDSSRCQVYGTGFWRVVGLRAKVPYLGSEKWLPNLQRNITFALRLAVWLITIFTENNCLLPYLSLLHVIHNKSTT